MNNIVKKAIFIASIFIILFFIIKSSSYIQENFSNDFNNEFSRDWNFSIKNTDIDRIINLPYHTNDSINSETVVLEKKLPDEFVSSPYICVGSSQQSFIVYLEDDKIYEFKSMIEINHGKTGGTAWRLIPLSQDCFGKTLRIEINSSYDLTSGALSEIYFGSKSFLILNLMSLYIVDILFSILLFTLAVAVLVITFILRNLYKIKFEGYYLSSVIFCASIWIFGENQGFLFLFNNYALNYYIQFISLFIGPYFLYKYISLEYEFKHKSLINILSYVHYYLFFIILIFQLFGILTFFQLQWILLPVLFCTLIICITIIIIELFNKKNLIKLVLILIIFLLCIGADTLVYNGKTDKFTFNFTVFGILIITIFITFLLCYRFINLLKIEYQNKFLEAQINSQLVHYSILEQKNMYIRAYYHDIKKHLRVINSLIEGENFQEVKEYTCELVNAFTKKQLEIINTGNPIFDAIINEKIQIAKDKDIQVQTEILIKQIYKLDMLDWCIIFGNILDNAIEACEKNDKDKYIKMKIICNSNMLVCKIINSSNVKNGTYFADGFTTKLDKDFHGLGLKNIKKTIEKYGGDLNIKHDNFVFELSFILYDI